jgi:cytochrome c oxidase subunit 2
MLSWLPEDVSTYGADIDRLFRLIYYITGATFVVVEVLLVVFIIMYRRRPGGRATYTHGNTPLEIAWTIVPALILVMLGVMSRATWGYIRGPVPPTDFHVEVLAKQFNWEMTYPGADGTFGSADDFRVDNDLHVPVNKVVRLTLKSRDVIHSFFVPNLRLKQDAVPGRAIDVWFQATKPGKYEIPCAELCGFGHSGMRGYLYVYTAAEYDNWVKQRQAS